MKKEIYSNYHNSTVCFRVHSDRALFTDPIFRVGGEKRSYPVPTYGALKGIISSVLWKPTIIWYIDQVRIMNEICNESENIINLKYYYDKKSDRDLSIYTYLSDVSYKVKAHFDWNYNRPEFETDRNEKKFYDMTMRALEQGPKRDVFLGTRECQGYVEPTVFEADKGFYDATDTISFGYMFHSYEYPDEVRNSSGGKIATSGYLTSLFHNVVMNNGIINFPLPGNIQKEHRRTTKNKMNIKTFINHKEKSNGNS